MRRDWDLARRILLAMEAQETARGELHPDQVQGYDAEIVSYHIRLLRDAGLIEAECSQALGARLSCIATSLTWTGHEFLDAIRRDTVWHRVQGLVRERGLELSFDVITSAARAVIGSILKGG